MVPSQPGSPAWPGCLPLGDQPPIASPKNVFVGCLFHISFVRFFSFLQFSFGWFSKNLPPALPSCLPLGEQPPIASSTIGRDLKWPHYWWMDPDQMVQSLSSYFYNVDIQFICQAIHLPLSSMAYPPWRHVVPQWRTFVNKAQWNCRMLKSVCQGCRRFLTISDPKWDQPIRDIFI